MSSNNVKKSIYHIKHPSPSLISNSVLFFIEHLLSKTNIEYPRLVFSWGSKDSCEFIENGNLTVNTRRFNNELIEKKNKENGILQYQISSAVLENINCPPITFDFNSHEILFSIKKSGQPLCIDASIIDYYQVIEISADSNSILDEFLLNSLQ